MKYIKYLLLLCLITACNPSDTKTAPEGSIESPVITNDLSNQKVTALPKMHKDTLDRNFTRGEQI